MQTPGVQGMGQKKPELKVQNLQYSAPARKLNKKLTQMQLRQCRNVMQHPPTLTLTLSAMELSVIIYFLIILGYVFKALDSDGNPVAIKRSQKVGNKVSREFEVLSELTGLPNVIQLVDFFYSLDSKERLIQNSVFEFCDKNLEDVLKEVDKKDQSVFIPLHDIKRYSKEILNGLSYMHEKRIVHRDLKPENILLMNGEVKICDFGSSKFIDEQTFKNTPYVVSRYYRAPELILATNKYNEAIDIWAVGCILFELLTRTPTFPGDTEGLQILE